MSKMSLKPIVLREDRLVWRKFGLPQNSQYPLHRRVIKHWFGFHLRPLVEEAETQGEILELLGPGDVELGLLAHVVQIDGEHAVGGVVPGSDHPDRFVVSG